MISTDSVIGTPSFNRFSDFHFHVTPKADSQTRRQDNNNSFTVESKTRASTMVSEPLPKQRMTETNRTFMKPPKSDVRNNKKEGENEGLNKKWSQSILENQERPSSNISFQKLAQRRSSSPVPKLEPIPTNNIYKVKEQAPKRKENVPVFQKRLTKPFTNGENLLYRGFIQGVRQDFTEMSRPSTTVNDSKTQNSFTKAGGNASVGLYYNNLKNVLGKRSDNLHATSTSITPNRRTTYQSK